MPSVAQAGLLNTPSFTYKEKSTDSFGPAFTAVNGRTSLPSPPRSNDANGITDTVQNNPHSRQSPEHMQDQRAPLPRRDDWNSMPRASENGHQNGQRSVLSPTSDQDRSPSPGKRKRASTSEEESASPSSDGSGASSPRVDSHAPIRRRNDSPNTMAQVQRLNMDHPQSRTLPPMDRPDRPDADGTWGRAQDGPHNGYTEVQHRDERHMGHPSDHTHTNGNGYSQFSGDGQEHSSTTEITRAGVQVDPKKRKRQFANRTKTGCGTCRRRKKKCDEAKPECNNCQRGGFICEGYANKVPWPKNQAQKPHPLQAKDRYSVDPAQLYHNHGNGREGYTESTTQAPADGGRGRPINVDEADRQNTNNNGWGNGWGEPHRQTYPPEQRPPPDYSQPPPPSSHGVPTSSDQHPQGSSRPHNPRIYHHTPQTMEKFVSPSPSVAAEAALHHQPQPPPQMPPRPPQHLPPTGAPRQPPAHYAPPPPQLEKSEKEKMFALEPFQPYARQLIDERTKCKEAIWRFNNTDNPRKEIGQSSRDIHFRSILEAVWTRAFRTQPNRVGHFGPESFVETPFYCDYGYNISIGERVDIANNCKFLDSGRISIGRDTTIGANVTIDTLRTPTDTKSPKGSRRTAIAAEVHIGESVHIGSNCTILAGVRIGTGAIIQSGSVVVRDVPAHSVARGNPAVEF